MRRTTAFIMHDNGKTNTRSAYGRLLLAVAAWLLAACSGHETSLTPLSPDAVILAFGDSLTYGTGAGRDHSYPAELERLTGRRVINAGVPGELSGAGARRLPQLLEQYHPDLVILCHGANDLMRKQSKTKLAENLRTMIRQAQGRGAGVVLIGVPMPRLAFLKTDPVYAEIAQEFQLPIENGIIAELEGQTGLKSDHVHFNAAGYRRMAEAVVQLLRESGGL